MIIDWSLIDEYEFESLCYDILGREGYIERDWFGVKGSDRGRDIECKKIFKIAKGIESIKSCLVQCKRYIVRPPAVNDLSDTINWAISHNRYNVLIFMISNTISSNTRDYLKGREKEAKFSIELIEEKYFDSFFKENYDLYDEYFTKKRYAIKNRVLISLCKGMKTIDNIHKEFNIPVKDINNFVDYYMNKNILSYCKDNNEIIINNDKNSFIEVSKDLLSSYYNFDYMESVYLTNNLDNIIIDILESKLLFTLKNDTKYKIIKLIKISPSCLYYVLFNDFVMFKEGVNHLNLLTLSDEEKENWIDAFTSALIQTLLERTISYDSHNINFKNLLIKNNIEAYKINLNYKLASINNLELDISTESIITLMKLKGSVKAGQLLTADVDGILRFAGLSLNLHAFKKAIELYKDALARIEKNDVERYILINNNIGVSLLRMKKWSDAIYYFNKVLKIEPDHKEALNNTIYCEKKIEEFKYKNISI